MSYFNNRIKKLRMLFPSNGIDAVLVAQKENINYFSSLIIDDSFLFITEKDKYVITDSRYIDEVRAKIGKKWKITVISHKLSLSKCLQDIIERNKVKKIGFEDLYLSCYQYNVLSNALTSKELKPLQNLFYKLRLIKDEEEIIKIRNSIKIAQKAFRKTFSLLRNTEMRESDFALRLEFNIREAGAESVSFPPIVASGEHAAFPHATVTKSFIKKNDILLIDFGAKKEGYCSDLTRTVFLGRITDRFKSCYDIISEAQLLAIEAIKPGVIIGEVDLLVRNFLKKHKLEKFFTHSLGHGIGLEIHEYPSLFHTMQDSFEENMVVTVEPGIYINGWGGVRIEDMVLVTSEGAEVLTKFKF